MLLLTDILLKLLLYVSPPNILNYTYVDQGNIFFSGKGGLHLNPFSFWTSLFLKDRTFSLIVFVINVKLMKPNLKLKIRFTEK